MKILFFISINFIFISSFSQKFYFPSKDIIDTSALHSSLAQLSKQLIKTYKEENKQTYLDNLLRLEIVAQEYEKSLLTLDTIRSFYRQSAPQLAPVISFNFQLFSKAKLYQLKTGKSFDESYKAVLADVGGNLTENQINIAGNYFETEIGPLQNEFNKLLKKQSVTDSISLTDARQLCRAYLNVVVAKSSIPLGKPFFTELEKKFYSIEEKVTIKTKDGASLQATIVRSKKYTSPLPAILNFNIYIGARDKTIAKMAAVNGYVGIVVNTRGKGLSPQEIEPFEKDAADAYEIIDWISKQEWCNGKIGMYGGSYLGFSQWAATKNLHPALKTIVPQVSVGIGIDYPMQNNVFMSYMLRWVHFVSNSKQTDNADFENEEHWNHTFANWYKMGTAFKSLDSIEGRQSPIFQRWLKHPAHDSYWQNMVPYKTDFSRINIPVLTTTGYYDDDQLGAMYYYKEHLIYNPAANHTLLIGPYDHPGGQGYPVSELNGYKIDPVANINIRELTFKWFDYILKDSIRPAILKDKVNYQVMGTNTWKHTPALHNICNDTLRFYFSNVHSGNHFKLLTKKQAEKEFIRQEVNYLDRSDTTDTADDEKIIAKEVEKGEYISFISEPLDTTISINGTFTGELKSIINKKDMDVSIILYEQLPDGRYFYLSDFLGRASYAKDRSKRQLLTPGKLETIPYTNSFFTSKRLSKGSRLIVLVGINKNKYWQINYGTGKDVSDETILDGKVPLQIQWFNDSYINVPVWKDK